jgi:phenylacetate-CoA ligase
MRPGDVCLHAYSMSKGFIGGLPMVQGELYFGMTALPIGAEAGVDRLLAVAQDQHATVAIGTPYFMIYLAEQAEERIGVPAKELGIRAILVGGEPGAGIPVIRERLEQLWGATVGETFGGTDAGLGYWGECEVGDGMHFLAPDFIVPEIIDPDTEDVLEPAPGV